MPVRLAWKRMIFTGSTQDTLPITKSVLKALVLLDVMLPELNTLPVADPPMLLQNVPSQYEARISLSMSRGKGTLARSQFMVTCADPPLTLLMVQYSKVSTSTRGLYRLR